MRAVDGGDDGDADAYQTMAVSNSMSPVPMGNIIGMGSPSPGAGGGGGSIRGIPMNTRVSFTINEDGRQGAMDSYNPNPSPHRSPKHLNQNNTNHNASSNTNRGSLAVSASQIHFPRLTTSTKIPHNTLDLIKTQSFRGQASPSSIRLVTPHTAPSYNMIPSPSRKIISHYQTI